jgi:hypothetical protein
MIKYIVILFFISSLFISCLNKKPFVKEDISTKEIISAPLVKKEVKKKEFPIRKKKYSIREDLYNTRLFIFDKKLGYLKRHHKNNRSLWEAEKLRERSYKYFLLGEYDRANYYIIEALVLLEEER